MRSSNNKRPHTMRSSSDRQNDGGSRSQTSANSNNASVPRSPVVARAPSMRTTNFNRSRSARSVVNRNLPILERGGSTRNFRELPPVRNALESPASTRNLRRLPGEISSAAASNNLRPLTEEKPRPEPRTRRSNSTRRFFVPDHQSSRNSGTSSNTGSGSAVSLSSQLQKIASRNSGTSSSNTNTVSGTTSAAASLSTQLRKIALERSDSASSMGSMQTLQSLGLSDLRSLGNTSRNDHSSIATHDTHDSGLSLLSMETFSLASRGTLNSSNNVRNNNNNARGSSSASHGGGGGSHSHHHHHHHSNSNSNHHHPVTFSQNVVHAYNQESVSTNLGDADSEVDMMSLYSRDSVGVRQQQLDASSLLNNTNNNNNNNNNHSNNNNNVTDEDMVSVANSECTVYSFDLRPPALSPSPWV